MDNLKIDIPPPERGFKLIHEDGFVLITPGPTMMSYTDWAPEEYIFRSLMVRESNGEVVSASFPKFFNLGEGNIEGTPSKQDQDLITALSDNNPVYFTEKIDGSCIIRSVIDGKVRFRTRGTMAHTPFVERAEKVAREKYPILFDPLLAPERSLIFELVSPDFRIILHYPYDDLVFIGEIFHHDLFMADIPRLKALAQEYDFNIMPIHTLPTNLDDLVAEIKIFENREGIVARCNEGQTLVKLKSASYLALHRLRFSLSAKRIREICIEKDIKHISDFEAFMKEHEADWELLSGVRPMVELFLEARSRADGTFAEIHAMVEEVRGIDRKQFALDYALPLGKKIKSRSSAAFAIMDGDHQKAYLLILRGELDIAFSDVDIELPEA